MVSANTNVLFLVCLDDLDTDLETDRLLGQQRNDDQGFFDENIVSTHIA